MGQSWRRMWPLIGVLVTAVLSSGFMTTAATATETTGKVTPASGAPPAVAAPPIVGGEPASIEEYPWVVYLANENGDQFCGGTIVRPNKVVTAAHCVEAGTFQTLNVVAGRENIQTQTGTVAGVTDIWVHPLFQSPETGADVAVLTLDRELEQKPLRLALRQDGDLYAPGTDARVLGWGSTTEGGPSATLLRNATVRMVSDPDCAKAYGGQFRPNAMVCAGVPEGGVDACQGDSGGPLVAGDKLVGIVSFGTGCGRPGLPGVYTRTASYHDDIQAQLDSAMR